MTKRLSEGLEAVFAARAPEELAAAYATWSGSYDRETLALGYCLPFVIAGWIARYVGRNEGPLLDAGCGTGLSGPYVAALGYTVHGLDVSEEMLAFARGRHVYEQLTRATLGRDLPFADNTFRAVFSSGVFTEGHAPASSLHELVRIARPGGHVMFTVRDVVLEAGGFRQVFSEIAAAGRWRPREESPPFRSFAVAEPDVLAQVFVFEVL